jgi:hypothetical protein
MATDALWVDVDEDHFPELMVVGEFMPVTLFKNNKGTSFEKIEGTHLDKLSGWWYSIEKGDFDNDGDQDFIAGNLGLNNRWNASPATPVRLYAKTLSDASVLPILTYFLDNQQYTIASRDQIAMVYPAIKAVLIIINLLPHKRLPVYFPQKNQVVSKGGRPLTCVLCTLKTKATGNFLFSHFLMRHSMLLFKQYKQVILTTMETKMFYY